MTGEGRGEEKRGQGKGGDGEERLRLHMPDQPSRQGFFCLVWLPGSCCFFGMLRGGDTAFFRCVYSAVLRRLASQRTQVQLQTRQRPSVWPGPWQHGSCAS